VQTSKTNALMKSTSKRSRSIAAAFCA